MTCKRDPVEAISTCPRLAGIFEALTTLGFDALFLYDGEEHVFLKSQVLSPSIKAALGERSILEVMQRNNPFNIEEILRADFWAFGPNPFRCRLSMNVCIDERIGFFVNAQLTPMRLTGEEQLRFFVFSLQHSAFNRLDVTLIDTESKRRWLYDTRRHAFELREKPLLSPEALELVRLASLGLREDEIARAMHYSTASIKKKKSAIFDEVGTNNMAQVISYARLHHLL